MRRARYAATSKTSPVLASNSTVGRRGREEASILEHLQLGSLLFSHNRVRHLRASLVSSETDCCFIVGIPVLRQTMSTEGSLLTGIYGTRKRLSLLHTLGYGIDPLPRLETRLHFYQPAILALITLPSQQCNMARHSLHPTLPEHNRTCRG